MAQDKAKHDQNVLVLQGGGALGAYQAGVYEGMTEHGIAPDWVTGVSIGAINGALVQFDPVRTEMNRFSALASATFGVPGFFSPRMPPPLFAPDGTPGALSIYDTSPLRSTLEELVDFDLLNDRKHVRFSIGAVNVHTGNSVYFDNRERIIGPEHIMASGSLPPGFPPVVIDGESYWDGGIVSNSPL